MEHLQIGATYQGNSRCEFVVWAPVCDQIQLHIVHPQERIIPLQRIVNGYYRIVLDNVSKDTKYYYMIEGKDFPDPASRYQADGVHGASQVIDPTFDWHDQVWRGHPQENLIFYELHVGTFTVSGTFDAIIPELDRFTELGITAVELMPVCQFPGERNWGYDLVGLYAVQSSYGGPDGLRRLVDACHQRHLAVFLDMVYNHFGPEGNYLPFFGPYFTDKYKGSWGAALNFDGSGSDAVRQFFIQNAFYWMDEYHIDGFRLDAIDHIVDTSAVSFWEELSAAVQQHAQQTGRRFFLFSESDQNNARLTRPQTAGGIGIDGHWLYDFHHTLYPLLVDEPIRYYMDFTRFDQIVTLFRDGYVYQGQYAPRRGRRWGTPAQDVRPERLVAYMQTHDRTGNRPQGERLTHLISFEALKLAAACVILSPFLPLLFMGEEYAETAPFLFFTDNSDPRLIEMIPQGRRNDAAGRGYAVDKPLPAPNDETTFQQSKLNPELRHTGEHQILYRFYKELIALRKSLPGLQHPNKATIEVIGYERERVLAIRRWHHDSQVLLVFNISDQIQRLSVTSPIGNWRTVLNSAEEHWRTENTANGTVNSRNSNLATSDGRLRVELIPWSVLALEYLT